MSLSQDLLDQFAPEACRRHAAECRRVATMPDTSRRRGTTLNAIAQSLITISRQVERLKLIEEDE